MSDAVVIADASPLIALARIGHLHLLHELFSTVVMTDIVRQEVLLGGDFADSVPIQQAVDAGWLQVMALPVLLNAPANLTAYVDGLDPGETSAILWAADLQQAGQSVLLVMDEAKGRAVARQLSLEIMGSAGVIATAKRLRLIPQALPLLERLCASGYYLSQTVVDAALRIAGEK